MDRLGAEIRSGESAVESLEGEDESGLVGEVIKTSHLAGFSTKAFSFAKF